MGNRFTVTNEGTFVLDNRDSYWLVECLGTSGEGVDAEWVCAALNARVAAEARAAREWDSVDDWLLGLW